MAGAKFGNPNTLTDDVGYEFKRLPEPVPTGIYECNERCKCSRTCLNRVAQMGLQMKLQVFKTGNRGWGLRCLNDVPKGSFICIYAGDLLTEQSANEAGDNFGDEYFAELDYIEVVEALKEGYEADVPDDEEEDDYVPRRRHSNDSDDDDDEFVAAGNNAAAGGSSSNVPRPPNQTRYNTRTRNSSVDTAQQQQQRRDDNSDEDESNERQPISFVPNANSESAFDNKTLQTPTTKYRSVRKFFGRNEYCYIMDAKKTGNIGRYFNVSFFFNCIMNFINVGFFCRLKHSCAPNLFVQNVFVDTHDLRFPWVAFFALSYIRAGTELTWNYNYDVGSVPGKVLYCECGAETCRGRLL